MLSPSDFLYGWEQRKKISKMISLYNCVFHWLKNTYGCEYVFHIGFNSTSIAITFFPTVNGFLLEAFIVRVFAALISLSDEVSSFSKIFVLTIKNKFSSYYIWS